MNIQMLFYTPLPLTLLIALFVLVISLFPIKKIDSTYISISLMLVLIAYIVFVFGNLYLLPLGIGLISIVSLFVLYILKRNFIYGIAIICLGMGVLFILFSKNSLAEHTMDVAYLFLVIGSIKDIVFNDNNAKLS